MTTNYAKWEALSRELEGEESSAAASRPDPSSGPLSSRVVAQLGPAMARFVVVQAPLEGREDNVDRFAAILKHVAEYPEVLDAGACEGLVGLALQSVNEGLEGYADLAGAANTLLAMREHGPVELFAAIATPADEKAAALRRKYSRREFVKEAFLERTLGKEEFARMRAMVRDAEEEETLLRCPVPCPRLVEEVWRRCVIS